MQIQWEVFITETQSLHPILPIQSCKWWVRYDFQTLFFLYTLLQINYGWEYQWHIITILFLVFELFFQSKTNYLIQFFYMVFPHNGYPCFLIFNSNPTHIQEVVFFLSFFLFQQQCKRLIFYSVQLNLLKR